MNDVIKQEILNLPGKYRFFRNKPDNLILNGVAVKSIFYKNPSYVLDEDSLEKIVVDGTGDNGIDCILTDLSSDHNDMIIMQCKCYASISLNEIKEAVSKMINAYSLLKAQKFDCFNDKTVSQYLRCTDEMEEGAKVKFVFVTSSPKNNTQTRSVISHFNNNKNDLLIQMDETGVVFETELIEHINDANSMLASIPEGTLNLDSADNVLYFSEDDQGAVVNISALSLKNLYGLYHNSLLSQNLRYFVKNKTIDKDVDESIKNKPNEFWFKNNGITIICDWYDVSGKVLRLRNFSIINGGQTTRKIYDSENVSEGNDFYLMCRVVRNPDATDAIKQQFIYEVSKATNSQKAIKPSDLRANNKEQKLFENVFRSNGIFYKTKRGMDIPRDYIEAYRNCDLPKVGKLALAGYFLMPGSSRNKPSIFYDDENTFYDTIFNENRNTKTAPYIKDLLYIDYYFDKKFIDNYRNECLIEDKKRFAGNCRTFVTAFTGFFAKYYLGDFTQDNIRTICNCRIEDEDSVIALQKILRKCDRCVNIFANRQLNLDERENVLDVLFKYAITIGFQQYSAYKNNQLNQDVVDETNWLKRDSSFYQCLKILLGNINDDPNDQKLMKIRELFVA